MGGDDCWLFMTVIQWFFIHIQYFVALILGRSKANRLFFENPDSARDGTILDDPIFGWLLMPVMASDGWPIHIYTKLGQ